MKISEILRKNPSLDIDLADKNPEGPLGDVIQKYVIDVEKTTNGLMTPSTVLGTLLAFYPSENINSKVIHDIAEKLLK